MTVANGLPVVWRKSSYSSTNGGACLEVGEGVTGVVPVRDSKAADGPALAFPLGGWGGFVSAIRRGDLAG